MRYAFRVRAHNSVGVGPWSTISEFVVGETDPVELPQLRKWGLEPGDGEIRVTWEIGYSPFAGYVGSEIAVVIAGEDWNTADIVAGNDSASTIAEGLSRRSKTITGLEKGVRYAVRMRVTHGDRAGPWSDVSEVVVGGVFEDPPKWPRRLRLEPGDGQIIASWSPPTDEGGAPITSYDVLYGIDSGGELSDMRILTVTTTRATLTGLVNGTRYGVIVRARNAFGHSISTGPRHARPGGEPVPTPTPRPTRPPRPLPEQPAKPTLESGDGQIVVTWETRVNARYEIDIAIAGRGWDSGPDRVSGVSGGGFISGKLYAYRIISGLTNGVRYAFRIRRVNETGAGPWSAVSEAVAGEGLEPTPEPTATPVLQFGKPQNLVITAQNGALKVSWDAVAGAAEYQLRYRQAGQGNAFGAPISVAGTSHTLSGLTNGQKYVIRVRAAAGSVVSRETVISATPQE